MIRRSAFTLIEVLIVTAIISVLAFSAVGYYQDLLQNAREATVRTNLQTIRSALSNYFKQNLEYPVRFSQLGLSESVQRLTLDKLEDTTAQLLLNVPDVSLGAVSSNPIHVPTTSMALKTLVTGNQAYVGVDGKEQQFNDVKISGRYQSW